MAKRGGRQPGAGRPKGTLTRPRLNVLDYFTDAELKVFWNDLKKRAKTDSKLAIYFAEQMTGKAPQPLQVAGEGGGPVVVKVVNYGDNTAV